MVVYVEHMASAKKVALFEEESDPESPEVRIEDGLSEWETGRIIELQSKFAHDPRFRIDGRFVDSAPGEWLREGDTNPVSAGGSDSHPETSANLRILGRVLGRKVSPAAAGQRPVLTPRFDPRKEDSRLYQVEADPSPEHVASPAGHSGPQQSKDVHFYEVSSGLKESLLEPAQFSLASLLPGPSERDDIQARNEASRAESIPARKYQEENPFRYDSSESESECGEGRGEVRQTRDAPKPFGPSARFFFSQCDPRFAQDPFWPPVWPTPSGPQLVRALSLCKRSAQKNARSASKLARKRRGHVGRRGGRRAH